jgi:hypothetical protein
MPERSQPLIVKQPPYQSIPKYIHLVFGPEATTHVWVVLDGDFVYVDTNGNGDLTEPGKRLKLLYEDAEITEGDWQTNIKLMVQPPGPDGSVYCQAAIQGQYLQWAFINPAERPEDAPIHHFHGPLRISLSGAEQLVRGPEPTDLWATIGTPNPGGSPSLLQFGEGVPATLRALAEIEFPNREAGKPDIRSNLPLQGIWGQPCCHALVRVPAEAGTGMARITLSFPDWNGARVAPTTEEVPIVEPNPKSACDPVMPRLLDHAPPAIDLARIDRTLHREPAYRGRPRYCLLLFGPTAETRIWLVLDGDTLYADTNGDGDLTEPGKQVTPEPPRSQNQRTLVFNVPVIPDAASGSPHTNLRVGAEPSRVFPGSSSFGQIAVEVKGRYGEYTLIRSCAESPSIAPLCHFGGPLQMELGAVYRLTRGSEPTDFSVQICTRYPTGEWAFIDNTRGIPADIHPLAEFTFPNRRPGGPPVLLRVPLTQRC